MTLPAEVILSILGSGFRVTSEDERMVDLVRELWGPFVVPTAPVEAHEMTVEPRGDAWYVHAPPDASVSAIDPWLVASTLRNTVSRRAIAGATSIVPLHAAAVERDGTFLVASGPPRTGKTTMLLDLLDRDWRLVTDDLVPIDPGTLTATPFPKPLSVREPKRWRRAARSWSVPEWLPAPSTVGLVPAAAVRRFEGEAYRPTILVFSHFEAGADPHLERLTAAQTVAWSGDNLHSRGAGATGVLPALARLAVGTPAYVIRYGSSAAAMTLLEKCLAGAGNME